MLLELLCLLLSAWKNPDRHDTEKVSIYSHDHATKLVSKQCGIVQLPAHIAFVNE